MENIYLSDKDLNSNFVGDWNATCEYCGQPHKDHIWKEHPDPTYQHRMPCEPQKLAMRKARNRKTGTAKTILFDWLAIGAAGNRSSGICELVGWFGAFREFASQN